MQSQSLWPREECGKPEFPKALVDSLPLLHIPVSGQPKSWVFVHMVLAAGSPLPSVYWELSPGLLYKFSVTELRPLIFIICSLNLSLIKLPRQGGLSFPLLLFLEVVSHTSPSSSTLLYSRGWP